MKAIIVSDLHIGSPHFLTQDFEPFLENLPENHELILNGDIINSFYIELLPSFIKAFKIMHKLKVTLGTKPFHVAQYAKKWKILYKVLRKNVNFEATSLKSGY